MTVTITAANSVFTTAPSTNAYEQNGVSDTVVVNADGYLMSTTRNGIGFYGLGQVHHADIYGTVAALGGGGAGILELDGTANIYIDDMGVVKGGSGIATYNANVTITNYGHISVTNTLSTSGAVYDYHSTGFNLSNYGLIAGNFGFGIYATGGTTHTIDNGGIIKGGAYAIFIDSATSADQVTNHGTISGSVWLGGGADRFVDSLGAQVGGTVWLGDGADVFYGNANVEYVRGGVGNDVVYGGAGNDSIWGGGGADSIVGGLGKDDLFADSDSPPYMSDLMADRFVFNSVAESGPTVATRDVIHDFFHASDKIDLRVIDANTKVALNQAFTFIGAAAFTGAAGQLHYAYENPVGTVNDKTIISGDINGDKIADFSIELTGLKTITALDFFL
jgi:serralysin